MKKGSNIFFADLLSFRADVVGSTFENEPLTNACFNDCCHIFNSFSDMKVLPKNSPL